ncbi:hypothetical protein KUTeg_021157 [Tegillarca granosa]|uniref:Uncharacterized protein n=1 Tax=Tegillarca granosa TaxID=220873 RepID=A0ABQ9EF86_TEGGR|nr:hypothetical protein KUTeg_021157 [Tegillarca granosa]
MASKKQCMIKTILTQFLSSSSDDSSDNDVEYAISIWMMTKSRISVQYLLESITEICISENISGILCRHSSGGSEQIPLHNRILILIWYMASLDKYSSIADRFGVTAHLELDSLFEGPSSLVEGHSSLAPLVEGPSSLSPLVEGPSSLSPLVEGPLSLSPLSGNKQKDRLKLICPSNLCSTKITLKEC